MKSSPPSLNQSFKGRGDSYRCLCCFHNDRNNPSMHIREQDSLPSIGGSSGQGDERDRGSLFYCFTCGASGDLFSFLSRKEGLPFMQAVQRATELLQIHPQIAVNPNITSSIAYTYKFPFQLPSSASSSKPPPRDSRSGIPAHNYLLNVRI